MKITVQPALLKWVRERASLTPATLAERLHVKLEQVLAWEKTGELTFKQAENLAEATYTPIGYLFLSEPPEERLPIQDFRAARGSDRHSPSPNLLDTIYAMQRRQDWMHEYLVAEGAQPLGFIGSATLQDDPAQVAGRVRATLALQPGWAGRQSTWTEALRTLREAIESAGIMVVVNGVVGNNTHRKLNDEEFRGFVLSDPYAPLIFVNGVDAKAAQMFTLAHELGHLWLGQAGVFNLEALQPANNAIERFCDRVAAEFLIPTQEFRAAWPEAEQAGEPYQFLARRFKVSPLVAARRALDLELIGRDEFFAFYHAYQQDERRRKPKSEGGDFYATQGVRIGRRFGDAVVRAVREGRILYGDAYALTGLRGRSFDKYAESLGYPMQ